LPSILEILSKKVGSSDFRNGKIRAGLQQCRVRPADLFFAFSSTVSLNPR